MASNVTASSTFNKPFTVVVAPLDAILTEPLAVANDVAPVDVNVEILVSPVTPKVLSKVTAWSTFNEPFTVVVAPLDAILTAPPPVLMM